MRRSSCVALVGLVACGRVGFDNDVTGTTFLYWIDNGMAIRRMRADGSEPTTVLTTPASCLAHDPVARQIYWCGSQAILRAGYDGAAMELVAATTGFVPNIAVDGIREQVYWSEYNTTGLWRSDRFGANPVQVLATIGVRDIELTADRARLFYAVDIGNDRISYLGLDGIEPNGDVFDVGASGVVNPFEIELDGRGHLFWLDNQSGSQKIERLDVDGTEPLDIVTGAGFADAVFGVAFDAASQRLFWSYGDVAIYAIDAAGGAIESIPVPSGSVPQRLLFVDVPD